MFNSSDIEKLDPIARQAVERSTRHTWDSRSENFTLGVIAGSIAAVICAIGWAEFAKATGMKLGIVAIALGMIVGLVVRIFGNGWEERFGVLAAVLAIGGCALGNYLSIIAVVAKPDGWFDYVIVTFELGVSGIIEVMQFSFGHKDVIFYTVAVLSSYRVGYNG